MERLVDRRAVSRGGRPRWLEPSSVDRMLYPDIKEWSEGSLVR